MSQFSGPPSQPDNPFGHTSAAKRYATARPYFHPLVCARITAVTGTSRFPAVLDVACGTGMSTRALCYIADQIEGIDGSSEMIAEAEPHDRIHYQLANAESLPFADDTFDLITVGLAFHWFDQEAFLREAHRVLKPEAWVVVYNSGFCGEMIEDETFTAWSQGEYQKQFPTPARRADHVTAESVEPHGFTLHSTEPFTHLERMSADAFVGYLLTQSNVIAAIEQGSTPIETAATWISDAVSPYFKDEQRTMKFVGAIWFLRAISTPH